MSNSAALPAQKQTLVKAGAGAGKTYTVQTTLADWVKRGEVKPDRILAVTFTTDAANEMRGRIRLSLLKEGLMKEAGLLQKSTISTIHAFGLEILRTFAFEAGNSPTPRQLTEQEQDILLREALDQVSAIQPLLDDLEHFGYSGGFKGDEYQEGVDQLTDTILTLIGKLRSLGKGVDSPPGEAHALLEQAKAIITDTYGHVQKDGTAITDELWRAIEAVKAEYPDRKELGDKNEWGNNDQTRDFVANIYLATRERLCNDWKLWSKLQFNDKFKKINEKHPRVDLAASIWSAAEKLSVHPGPLSDALQHIECLLTGVIEGLAEYQSTKKQAGLVDYGDMVHLANDMLSNNPEWLEEIASKYDCLIIDEFQDTNPLQYSLLRYFQVRSKYTLIVGDLKQSIMGFQGSDSRLFATLLEDSKSQPDAVKELDSNWRSTPELMGFLNDMGERLYGVRYQRLASKAAYQSDLSAVHALRFSKAYWNKDANARSAKPGFTREGNVALANHIAGLLGGGTQITDKHTGRKRPIRGSDIAVLARGHKRLLNFADALRAAGMEVQIQQSGFLACDAVQWVLNALQGLNNSRDRYAWLDLLTSPLIRGHDTNRLELLLNGYREHSRFEHELTERLTPLRKKLPIQPIKSQLLTIIEEARLFEIVRTEPQGQQFRTNLLKLLGLAEEFEALQPETLNAMGIAGKNASTFQVWLNQNQGANDEQPEADPQAENAVVLKTWHASKGLEWPVVMVLDAEKSAEPRFPSITMAYPAGGMENMLQQSFVQILPRFDDKTTEARFSALLADDETETNKNLYYVALTRAREQIILPCWEGYTEGAMLDYVEPLLNAQSQKGESALYKEDQILPSAADPFEGVVRAEERINLLIAAKELPEKLQHTVSPSLAVDLQTHQKSEAETTNYQPGLNLDASGELSANELGTWVHRLYQVYLMQPGLLRKALPLKQGHVVNKDRMQTVIDHLEGFKAHMEHLVGTVRKWECELQVSGLNPPGQVISGVVDLVVRGEGGTLLVDHKTNKEMSPDLYWGQLLKYRNASIGTGSVTALNWVRHGICHSMGNG
tara:strand:+ start:8568 stop:11759 length:3192 start_codon:yes stop_codon:yes gene_type:complete